MTEREIFLAALELPDDFARARYLARVCGANVALRRQVEALLRAHGEAGSFLGTPASAATDPVAPGSQASTSPEDAPTVGDARGAPPEVEQPTLVFLAPSARSDSMGRIGHYEVLQILGRGAFGIVFRAFDEVLHRVVAVKVLSPEMAATSPARKRFLREARSSAQVRHENVVQVYAVEEQPLPYIVMEFIPGETLQQRLDRVGPLEVPEVLRIARQIAEGLAAAHATDLIHRDVKPGNILIEAGCRKVKITDFGLARAADDASISQSGLVAGTPMYMAPEQASGDTLDQRADLFSLGSVIYQMIAGHPPFRANGTFAVLKRVVEDTPRPIRDIIPETPTWLCDIVAKLHRKNRDERYQSAREVADVLAACESSHLKNGGFEGGADAKPGRPRQNPERAGTHPGHWKWMTAAMAGVLVVPGGLEFFGATHLFHLRRHGVAQSGTETRGAESGRPVDGAVPAVIGQDLAGSKTHSDPGSSAGAAEVPAQLRPDSRPALEFNGFDSRVEIPSLHLDVSGPTTIEVWANPGLMRNRGTLLEVAGDGRMLKLHHIDRMWMGDAWTAEKTALRYHVAPAQSLERWVHVALCWDGGSQTLFVDGLKTSTEPKLFPCPRPETRPALIGSAMFGAGSYAESFRGAISEVRVSKAVRYSRSFAPEFRFRNDGDTLALYHCDEGKGNELKDSSGNRHHGKIIAAKWAAAAAR